MALFTDSRELSVQEKHRPFQGVKGWRKNALALLGYNSDGTKNTFGEIFGHGNVLLDHYAPKMIAEKDTKKVIDSAEGSEWTNQIASFEAAKDIVSLVGGGGAGAAGAGMGSGASAGAGALGKIGNISSKIEGMRGSGSALVDSMNDEAATMAATDNLEQGIANADISEYDEAMALEDQYTQGPELLDAAGGKKAMGSKGSLMTGDGKTRGVSNVMHRVGKGAKVLGSIANSFQARFNTASTLRKNRYLIGRRHEPLAYSNRK